MLVLIAFLADQTLLTWVAKKSRKKFEKDQLFLLLSDKRGKKLQICPVYYRKVAIVILAGQVRSEQGPNPVGTSLARFVIFCHKGRGTKKRPGQGQDDSQILLTGGIARYFHKPIRVRAHPGQSDSGRQFGPFPQR